MYVGYNNTDDFVTFVTCALTVLSETGIVFLLSVCLSVRAKTEKSC